MQRRKQPFYAERAIYYSTFQIQRQVEAGKEEYDFLPVYVVNILDFKITKDSENQSVKTVYRLYEERSHLLLTNRVTFIFIELPKFNKSIDELDGNILEGMYFCFKNLAELTEQPKILNHNVFNKIFEVTKVYSMDKVTRDRVIYKMTTERDLRNQMAYARKEAIEEGRAEGRAEGREEGREEGRAEVIKSLVRKMIAAGMPVEQIAELTELSIEEVTALK